MSRRAAPRPNPRFIDLAPRGGTDTTSVVRHFSSVAVQLADEAIAKAEAWDFDADAPGAFALVGGFVRDLVALEFLTRVMEEDWSADPHRQRAALVRRRGAFSRAADRLAARCEAGAPAARGRRTSRAERPFLLEALRDARGLYRKAARTGDPDAVASAQVIVRNQLFGLHVEALGLGDAAFSAAITDLFDR